MSAACPDPQTWLDYASGRIDAARASELAGHLDACADCLVIAGEALAEHRLAPTRDGSPLAQARRASSALPQRIGRYVVIELLGSGGMGEVLLAYDPSLDRRVAIKLAQRRPGDDTRGLEARLETEAQALARAADRHVVGVYDTGRFEGRPYVAMEYVRGATLKTWLATPRKRAQVLRVFTEAAKGLAAAHRVGVVHRDFKPDNVLLDDDGHARVTDFGLATLHERLDADAQVDRSEDDTQEVHTRTGAVLGTPGYMSPEQWDAAPTDARSDQFSFCVALHEALIGERPFLKPSIRGTRPTFERTPGSLRRLKEQPPAIRALLTRGLSTKPEDRFASMDELLAALERAQRPSRAPWFAVAAAIVALSAGGVAWASRSPCHGALERIRAPRLALPSPPERVTSLGEALEARWAAAWTQSCADTNELHQQPPEVLALRSECLGRQAQRYEQVLRQFTKSDEAAAKALEALEASPRPEDCLAVEPLLSVDAPPPAMKIEVAKLRDDVQAARVAVDLGEYADAHRRLAALEAPVKQLAFTRLDAELAYAKALLALRENDMRAARLRYREALAAALASRDLGLAALTAAELEHVSGSNLGLVEEVQLVDELAAALVARLDSRVLEGKLENVRGTVALERGRLDDAAAHFELALRLREEVFGRGHLETANVLGNLGLVAVMKGEYARAEALHREELAIREAVLGERHPQMAMPLEALASALNEQGRVDEAVALVKRAVALREAVLGPSHRLTLSSRKRLAEYELEAERFDEARRLFLALREAWPAASLDGATMASRLAELELLAGRFTDALRWSRAAHAELLAQTTAADEAVLWEREREAEILLAMGDARAAESLLSPLEATWRQREDAGLQLADVLALRAQALLASGRAAAAEPLIREARALYAPHGHGPVKLAPLALVQARVWFALGRRDAAIALAKQTRDTLVDLHAPRERAALDAWLAAPK